MSPFLIAIGVVALLGIGGSVLAYKKGYGHGQYVVEARYAKAAKLIQGKMHNAKVPKSEDDTVDDLRKHRF